MENEKEQTGTWYTKLLNDISSLAQELDVEDHQRSILRESVIKIAKQQYQIGNKSGIRWLLREQAKKNSEAVPA